MHLAVCPNGIFHDPAREMRQQQMMEIQ